MWYSGLLMAVIIIFGLVVITVSRVTLLQTVDQVLRTATLTIHDSIEPQPIDESNPEEPLELVYRSEELFSAPSVSVQVWQTYHAGTILDEPLLHRSSSDIVNMPRPLDPNYLTSDSPIINSIVVGSIPERVMTQPLFDDSGNLIGVVQVATPLTAIANANDQLLGITLVTATICIFISIGLGLWLSKHLLKPIDAIKKAAENVANADDLTNRIQWNGPNDELGDLSNVFNHMMGRLEHLFTVQQEFIGDVSHELRTPLTSIIGHLEIMDKYGVDKDSLDALHREATRMSTMVNDLLLLTRADSGELRIDLYPVELDHIGLDVFEQSVKLAKDRHLKLHIGRMESVQVNGNADRIRQLLLNLVSNAIKFTDDGGKITLSIYPDGQDSVIEVSDNGIGISEADKKRIFDRFFQADSARTRRDESDGAGLGLSIVRWIVDIHKGKIDVNSTIGEGTTFIVRLPSYTSTHEVTYVPQISKNL